MTHDPGPIPTLRLFPEVNRRLVELLTGLTEEDRRKPALCSQWTVKDVADPGRALDPGYSGLNSRMFESARSGIRSRM